MEVSIIFLCLTRVRPQLAKIKVMWVIYVILTGKYPALSRSHGRWRLRVMASCTEPNIIIKTDFCMARHGREIISVILVFNTPQVCLDIEYHMHPHSLVLYLQARFVTADKRQVSVEYLLNKLRFPLEFSFHSVNISKFFHHVFSVP